MNYLVMLTNGKSETFEADGWEERGHDGRWTYFYVVRASSKKEVRTYRQDLVAKIEVQGQKG